MGAMTDNNDIAITIDGLRTQLGGAIIHDGLDLQVRTGEIFGVVGGSGTGKSVLFRIIIGLLPAARGRIDVFGIDTQNKRRKLSGLPPWGVLFQDGALFSALTIAENIELPVKEHTKLSVAERQAVVANTLQLAGLDPSSAPKYPSEISGGMRKRAGLARALALKPKLLFLDEPTAGLDPIAAANFDRLVVDLKRTLNLTVVMITHDLDTLFGTCDRIGVLLHKRIYAGPIMEVKQIDDPWVDDYFSGPRGRAAATSWTS